MHGAFATQHRRIALVVLASALCLGPLLSPVSAVPPAAAAAISALGDRWIEHRVAPGERIAEIAELYGVSSERVMAWNKLDKDRPMIRTGQMLRILTSARSQSRTRASYTVRRGDSWSTLAKRFEVSVARIRDQWNDGDQSLQLGARIVVFRLPSEDEVEPSPIVSAAATPNTIKTAAAQPAPAPIVPIKVAPIVPPMVGAQSLGAPDRGRIVNAAQIPVNEGLYTLRNPEHSWGSSFAIDQLTQGIARFRATGFDREVVIHDMSQQRGGRFRPHHSHQSGRDVDIRLPLKASVAKGTVPVMANQVDWDAAWQLVQALIATDQVRFIFLSRSRQRYLYEAALRAGATKEALSTLIQFPRKARTALVRHSRGHTKHIHVRFKCGPDEHSCIDPGFSDTDA